MVRSSGDEPGNDLAVRHGAPLGSPFFGLALIPVYSAIGSKPEGILKEWHNFELQCPPHPSDQGVSQAQ